MVLGIKPSYDTETISSFSGQKELILLKAMHEKIWYLVKKTLNESTYIFKKIFWEWNLLMLLNAWAV